MELIYSDIDSLKDVISISSLDVSTRAVLANFLQKFVVIVPIENRKFITTRKDIEKWSNLDEALNLISKNSKWRIPTITEFIELRKLEDEYIEFKHSEFWVIDENNDYVLYNIETGKSLNSVTHDRYLDFDGSDFSKFTPFNKLARGIKLVRDLK
jgi:hypothetical protein